MARCSYCNKLCGVEMAEPDAPEWEYDEGTGDVTATDSIRLVLTSACCGDEVAEANLELADNVTLDHEAGCPANPDYEEPEDADPATMPPDDPTFTVEATLEPDDWYAERDRHGKPIKSFRYRKHYYGVTYTVTVTCDGCGATGEVSERQGEQASAFEQLN